MGRLIDADVLREEIYSWGMNDYEPSDFTDAIDDALTVEAIPKADYEHRLKADMVVILEDLKQDFIAEAYGIEMDCTDYVVNVADIDKIIQQKINSLKAEKGAEQ